MDASLRSSRRSLSPAGALVVLTFVSAFLLVEDAMATEEPRFMVVEKTEAFEIRRYEPMVVAEMDAGSDFDRAGYEAFRPLAGFIGGNNRRADEIAMTTPVMQEPRPAEDGERIAMTAPVTQQPDATGNQVVAFVMPTGLSLEDVPRPADDRIRIVQVPERSMAVRPYRGGWSRARFDAEEAALLAGLEAQGLTPAGPAIFARYNSPFSIPFFRRNEVMVPLAPEAVATDG